MAPRIPFFSSSFVHRRLKDSGPSLFFFVPTCLAFTTCVFIFFYISSTSNILSIHLNETHLHVRPPVQLSSISSPPSTFSSPVTIKIPHEQGQQLDAPRLHFSEPAQVLLGETTFYMLVNDSDSRGVLQEAANTSLPADQLAEATEASSLSTNDEDEAPDQEDQNDQLPEPGEIRQQGRHEGNNVDEFDVFHDKALFQQEYKEMNKSLKIFVYPHKRNDPFANVLLPVNDEPGGNYASESYFKKALFKSHFITKNPLEADLFYLPFSIASLRHDKRVGVGGIQGFVRDYIRDISKNYPYWNRTGGADHFYVACHSVGRSAMEKATEVKLNAIQVVCSSSYFLPGYVAHKDASVPQIWPRKGNPPIRSPSKREKLAFYAGAMNSRVREFLVQVWKNDAEISVHRSRLKTPYSEALLGSKFCIHAKGFEVNTARIGDALYYGCVPVILADHYDLPFADIINWNSFSVVMSTVDIPILKKVLLQEINSSNYLKLQSNVMEVQKHFQWHDVPVDYDAFHMVMFELWLRRSHLSLAIN
ncbi:probable glycosyltransferase At5g11130 [Coffea arabica]|uniref:Probable glycosyltransferase At5g11130 n=1 Tax=Coffea arabica TaxID=13443 RepID=A0A6P6SJ16_COFAR